MTHSRWIDAGTQPPQTPSNYRDLLTEATMQIRKLRGQLDDVEYRQNEPIAIVGMSCRFPGGANTPEAYWALLKNGVDAVTEIPSQRWNVDSYYDTDADAAGKMYTRYGSFIDKIDQFDPQFFSISPREAHSLDPQQRLLLETSYTALENAGLPPFDLQGSATGVFVGLSFDDYAQHSVRSGDLSRINAFSSLGNTRSIAAGRIAYVFGFQGPTMQLDTTCSSSLLAVHLACQSLRSGESNLALAGGVSLMLSPEVTVGFCKLKALSPDGRCKTFDATADGYGRGEGCGVVVLKRLSDAIANQDNILALVKGSAVNHDGVSNGLTAPNGSAQTAVIRQAIANAKLSPQQIQYVEAHGTGTSLGDPIELLALGRAMGSDRLSPLVVGSVKTNFGHLEAAAGVAGLMKVVLALQHQQIPPHLHLTTPNPHIPWEKLAVEVPQALMPWPDTNEPKRAGLSGFGMSGTNVHLVIEEAISENAVESMALEALCESDRPSHILTLSAQSDAALHALTQRYKSYLATTTASLSDICFSANTGRSHFSHRLALIATNKDSLVQQIDRFSAKGTSQSHSTQSVARPKIAFLFTGQGAQYTGMGQQLYEIAPVFRAAIDRCADILVDEGIDLLGVMYAEKPTDRGTDLLHQTAYSQPALFAIAHALTELWKSWGIHPDCVLGHSIGEYAAAHAAGVISLEDGLHLVAARGRLMQSLPAGSGMIAVMTSKEQIFPYLSDGAEVAAVNGPEHAVVAGELMALEAVTTQLEAEGFRVKPLQVSHAFHSAQMEPMLNEFRQLADSVEYRVPEVEIVSSMTGQLLTSDDMQSPDWADYWVSQVRQPVQFLAAMETLESEGCNLFVEIGPKPTLTAMGQVCLPSLSATWVPSLSSKKASETVDYPDWETILTSLGQVYQAVAIIDWAGFDRAYPRQMVQLPNYPFQRDRYWIDAEEKQPNTFAAGKSHSLLGRSLSLAGNNVRCFEAQLQANQPLNWSDHAVFQSVLMPAAAYLEMGLAAGNKAFEGRYCLENICLTKGLWLEQTNSIRLQTLVTLQNSESYKFEIHSLEADTLEETWTNHVLGELQASTSENQAPVAIPETQKQLTKTFSPEQFYEQCAQRGVSYGPSFQAIKKVWYQPALNALAQVELPLVEATDFVMHPVLIDAGLQLSGATLDSRNNNSYLPVSIERFECYQPMPDGEIWIQAKRRDSGLKIVVDISWLTQQGHVLAKAKGLVLQAIEAKPALQDKTQWLHELVWQQQALLQTPAEFLLSPETVRDRLAPTFSRLIQQPDFRQYQTLQPQLDHLALAYIQQVCDLQPAPEHRQLFGRCLELLRAANLTTKLNPQQIYQQLSQQPQISAELTLLSRCGDRLADVFKGQVDPLTLLFPDGDLTDLTALYQSSIGARVMNQLVQEAVITIAAQVLGDRPLRILEIGAGTGGTTAHLLPQLSQLSNQVKYLFTDVSPRFISAAKARFQDFKFVEYALLDIEDTFQVKALSGDFDIAIAANVLHATADLQNTLTNVGHLLAPGGQLILLEGTQPVGWIDLIFGLTPGWWTFTDTSLRPKHPLISAEKWQTLLTSVGFERAVALQPKHERKKSLSQSVIVAQRQQAPPRTWGLLNVSAEIISRLEEKKQIVYDYSPTEDFQGDAVVCDFEIEKDSSVVERTESVCRQALALIQAVAQRAHSSRLYFISINPTPKTHLALSSLWGLLQTAQLEHPELRCTYIQAETAEQLAVELLADSLETQVIYHEGQRTVARIEDYRTASLSASTRLVADQARTLSGLRWQLVSRRQPNADEVEIRVHSTGLNFRDVLIAIGEYPDAAPLGCECVGEVVAVGEAIAHLQTGQRVMAIAPSSFAQYVTVHGDLVALVPENLTTEAAATLPVTFTTAYYSLCQLAKLKTGDRILIHSAAGGVGQAAVQIAQQIGAEIFATASPSKWDTLRAFGITHIMNSRTLAFADEIMAATQGEGVNVVLNALPGEFREKSLQSLGRQGRFVDIGKGEGLTEEQIAEIRPDVRHFIVDLSVLCKEQPQQIQEILQQLIREVNAGHWRQIPYITFPQSETVQAFRTLQQANHTGKMVLTQDVINQNLDAIAQLVQIQAKGTYLITGGLGGLGLVVAKWMAEHGAQQITLLSRQEPTAQAQVAIDQLKQQGVTVSVVLADVTDSAAMKTVLSEISQQSDYPLRGVIHAAGVLADGLIQQLDWADFERVLAPKVSGAWNLHRLTQDCNLDFFVLFSSAAALLGSPGQANHAAANAFLDGLACYRHQQGLPALSIDWGAWSTVGSALEYQARGSLEQFAGVEIISPEEGLSALERVWTTAAAQVGIVPIRWEDFLSQNFVGTRSLFDSVRSQASKSISNSAQSNRRNHSFIRELKVAAPEQKRELLETYVCERIGQTLGFSSDELDPQVGFFDLGMDSLTALELKNSLQADLNISLSSTLVFDYPTVEALLTYLATQLIGEETTKSTADNTPTDVVSINKENLQPLLQEDLIAENLIAEMDRKLADIENLLGEDAP